MKRLVWLMLVICPLAFAKVQPVVVATEQAESCCCEQSGSCEMPDCAPPPPPPSVALDRPAKETRSETRRIAKANTPAHIPFYTAYAKSADNSVQPQAPVSTELTVDTPLFQAHCSFLI
ncbi:MAG: hypothetical protein CMI16_11225 [Opitutaceae bacterium]|nr:hypothetical protein [Opitutaceae bacterium]